MGLSGGGDLLAFQQPSPSVRPITLDEGIVVENFYQAPKYNGTVVVGSPKAEVGCNSSVSVDGALHLLTVAMQLLLILSPGSTLRHVGRAAPENARFVSTLRSNSTLGECHDCKRTWRDWHLTVYYHR